MLPLTKKYKGFTLIELLVATVIMAAVSLVAVQILWSTISVRSKQSSIEDSSDNIRTILSKISKNIISAKQLVSLSLNKIQLLDNTNKCLEISYNSAAFTIIEKYYATPGSCAGAATSSTLTRTGIAISKLEFTQVGNVISVNIEGKYKDHLGEHLLKYSTSASPRTYL